MPGLLFHEGERSVFFRKHARLPLEHCQEPLGFIDCIFQRESCGKLGTLRMAVNNLPKQYRSTPFNFDQGSWAKLLFQDNTRSLSRKIDEAAEEHGPRMFQVFHGYGLINIKSRFSATMFHAR